MTPRFWLLLPGVLACSTALAAESGDDLFLAEMPVVLTASRIQQSPLDAPAPVTVIDRQTIEATGFTEIKDLMRLVPGFQVASWPGGFPYHGADVVANHGMGSAFPRTLLVMLDGQSVVDPIKGSVDWEDLPIRIKDIERIEVVRGPNQASYGAGAYNGVINIITRQPLEDAGGLVEASIGRKGFRDLYARYGHAGEATDWRMSVSDRHFDAFDESASNPYRKDTTRQTLNGSLVHRLGIDQELIANVGLSIGDNGLGSGTDTQDPYHSSSEHTQLLQLAWHSTRGESETYLKYSHYGHQQKETFELLPSFPVSFDADTSQDKLEFQKSGNLSKTLAGVLGASVQYDQVDSPHFFYGKGTVTDTSWQVFGNLDWHLSPDWLAHVGGMIEDRGNTRTLFSPRLALNYAISPKQSLRLSMGQGYRAPTLLESDSNEYIASPYGNQTGYFSALPVDPEKVKFAELGYVGRFDSVGMQVDGRVFVEQYSQYLNPYSCYNVACVGITGMSTDLSYTWVQVFRNGGKTHVVGGEVSADWKNPVIGRVLFSYSAMQIHAGDFVDGSGKDTTQYDIEQSAPAHSASLLWSKSLPWRLTASAGVYFVGGMKWLGDGDMQPSYKWVNFKLAKGFGDPTKQNEVAITAQGITGNHAEFVQKGEMTFRPVRQAFVTLRLGF